MIIPKVQNITKLHFGIALWQIFYYNKSMKKQYSKKYIIETGMGLQDVDGLKNSSYFINESNRYLKGEISLDELDAIINTYYKNKPSNDDRSDEADIIAVRIAKIISEDSFTFSVGQLLSIHRTLFQGVLNHPGELRPYNFTKNEWVLNGASVTYGDYRELEATLQYDFEIEKKYRYQGLTADEIVEHLAIFVANLWQIHVFEEGNTRTTAVFLIKYLRSLGFDVTNDTFAKNAWYFRNALVRANYTNIAKEIYEDRSFLIKFLRNLLLNEKHVLKNRDLRIDAPSNHFNPSRDSFVLNLLKDNPKLTASEIADATQVSIRTIKSILKVLVNDKKIIRVNGKRYGYWKVISKDKKKN